MITARTLGKSRMAMVLILMSLPALAAQNGVLTSEGYEITVADGTDVTLNSDDISALATNTTSTALIKKGGGRLIIATNMSGWSGDFGISNGYVRLATAFADGKQDTGTLRLEPGATIELGGTGVAKNQIMLRRQYIYIGGTGVGGAGAMYAIGNSQNQILRSDNLHLTADTLFKCSPMMGPRGSSMYFNGHKLTVDGGIFDVCSVKMYGPGELHAINNCKVFMENATPGTFYRKHSDYTWREGDRSVIRLESGASIEQGPQRVTPIRCEWDLVCEGNASFISSPSTGIGSDGHGSWTASYGYSGPISTVAGGTLTFDVRNYKNTQYNYSITCPLNVTNDLSGGGNILVKCGAAIPGTLNLTSPNSTISGSLTLEGGVTVNCTPILPCITNGALYGKNSRLNIDMSAANLDDAGIYDMWKNISGSLTWPTAVGEKFLEFNYELGSDRTFSRTLTDPLLVYHGGTNALTVTSSANGLQNYINIGGDLVLAGQPGEKFKVGWIDVRGGTVTIPAGTYAEAVGSNCVFIAADYPQVARLVVKGTYVNPGTVTDKVAGGLYSARNYTDGSATRRGIIEVFDGALITNRIDGGNSASLKPTHSVLNDYSGAQGAYYQHGGTFITPFGYQYFGSYNNMYASIENGRFVNMANDSNDNNCRMGRRASVTSFIDISGGVFETRRIGAGQAGAQATICVSGTGSLVTYSYQDFPRIDTEAATGGSHGILAVDGANASITNYINWYPAFRLAGQFNGIGEVDINNGGTISANGFTKVLTATISSTQRTLTGNRAIVSFNGGVLSIRDYTGTKKIFREFTAGTDHVYVHSGGATIDTRGIDMAMGASLEAPYGNGVESIPLPAAISSLKAWDYIAAPAVTITDPTGTGTGATAVAIFNTTTGRVTGFRILNRGNNYTSAQATISKGGYTNSFTVACTLSANVSGGLTKKGEGRLVLDCANTYTGATVVAGGTLVLSNEAALASTRSLRLEGGTLDLTTQDIPDLASVDEVVLAGGTVVNDAGSVTLPNGRCSLDLAAAKAGNATTVTSAMTLPGSFNLLNGELAVKADRHYTLLILPENYSGQTPTVTGIPVPWVVSRHGRKLRMDYPQFQVIFR